MTNRLMPPRANSENECSVKVNDIGRSESGFAGGQKNERKIRQFDSRAEETERRVGILGHRREIWQRFDPGRDLALSAISAIRMNLCFIPLMQHKSAGSL